MATTFNIRPNPIWYIADLVGRPLGAGKLYTRSSLNKSIDKPVFTDPAGIFPWTNPILFNENGQQGPFYFEFDDSNPDDLYYLEVYDENDALVWTVDNFSGAGGGGGGNITTTVDTTNYLVNGQFWRNIEDSFTPLAADLILAPGAHAGFSPNQTDIRFHKTNTSATDRIRFTKFYPTDTNALTGDVTPEYFLDYECTVAGTGEIVKYVEFPIVSQVQNMQNQDVSIVVWAKSISGPPNLTVYLRSFYGDGAGASTEDRAVAANLTLGTDWTKHVIQTTTTAIAGKTIGTCGNSGLFLQFEYPLDTACRIGFTKPALYLGHISPDEAFDTYDQTDAVINAPRTGDTRVSLQTQNNFGWLRMNDTTIGTVASAATGRANVDTFPLYALLYMNVSDTWAPVTGGRTGSGTTFAEAATDFAANKPLALTKTLGRVMSGTGIPSTGGTGTNWVLGQFGGEEQHILDANEIPTNLHVVGPVTIANTSVAPGGALGHNTIQPTVHYNIFIKL